MTEKLDKEVNRLFTNGLLPLARTMRARGVTFLEAQLSKDAPSYFVQRPRPAMSRADFETGGCTSPETAEADLARVWSGGRDEALAALAPRMAELARSLRKAEEEAGDVSTSIYVMY